MSYRFRTIRYLLTAVLVIGTGLAGVAPRLVDAATVGVQSTTADATPVACCCGTVTGNCCKAGACDSRNAPTPEPAPSPARDNVQNPTPGLVHTLISAPAVLLGGATHDIESETLNRSLADATLQTAHVRLDT